MCGTYCLLLLIYSFALWLFNSTVSNFHIFVNFLIFLTLLIFSFIPLLSEKKKTFYDFSLLNFANIHFVS